MLLDEFNGFVNFMQFQRDKVSNVLNEEPMSSCLSQEFPVFLATSLLDLYLNTLFKHKTRGPIGGGGGGGYPVSL